LEEEIEEVINSLFGEDWNDFEDDKLEKKINGQHERFVNVVLKSVHVVMVKGDQLAMRILLQVTSMVIFCPKEPAGLKLAGPATVRSLSYTKNTIEPNIRLSANRGLLGFAISINRRRLSTDLGKRRF
jgi:hypothetical protein